jgi:hypothetical protein
MTFAKALSQLVESKIVLRDHRRGRKAVVVAPNPAHPIITRYTTAVADERERRNERFGRFRSMAQRLEDFSEPMPREVRKAWVRMVSCYYAHFLAQTIVHFTFSEARLLSTSPNAPLLSNMLSTEVMSAHRMVEALLIKVFKQNIKQNIRVAHEAMNEWLNMVHGDTLNLMRESRALVEASSSPF